ncbi:crotonase/enoyl-CoA hydratase family protein [Chelatococcus sp. SYSU_G07232]|uniref:Crotonase/enoyl-CoA hydratase family protein n=1 Tax=Chelatococcus albus TaxID=3047466 RepID=A0ABT7AM89_9HYPH|nr:crotonase/enoyl-CoA hydratase family protein [Chelatococcus sp. SYSU_G07232]MDJ1159686.1 crotonase/enoyl-CoA hydratase family protein [Chelatococcus sp. SYSU_G07232]
MTVTVEKQGAVTTVIHARHEARNAVDPASAEALAKAFLAFEQDPGASVAVLWGAGGVFCSGWDLKHAAALMGQERPLAALDFPPAGEAVPHGPMGPTRLELSKPVIAAIAGPAVAGGMEIALWCDLRVMEEDAYFGVYNRRWGIPLIDGGTVRLPRLVGEGRALDIILTGRKVTADEAARIGLCDRVVPRGEARAAEEALAQEIALFPQGAVRADRRAVRLQHGRPVMEAMRLEWQNAAGLIESEGARGAARFAAGEGRHGNGADA